MRETHFAASAIVVVWQNTRAFDVLSDDLGMRVANSRATFFFTLRRRRRNQHRSFLRRLMLRYEGYLRVRFAASRLNCKDGFFPYKEEIEMLAGIHRFAALSVTRVCQH
jgi:hypothetical protein